MFAGFWWWQRFTSSCGGSGHSNAGFIVVVCEDNPHGLQYFLVIEVAAWGVVREFSKQPFFQGLTILCVKTKPKVLISSFYVQLAQVDE